MKFPLFGSTGTGQPAATTLILAPMGRATLFGATNNPASIMPAAATIGKLNVVLAVPPGAGASLTFTLMKNGVATAVTFSVSGTNTVGNSGTTSAKFLPGDLISLQIVRSTGTVPALTSYSWFMTGDSDDASQVLFSSWYGGFNSTNGGYINPISGTAAFSLASESFAAFYITSPGTIKNLYAYFSTAPGGTAFWTVTLRKNGVATAQTCTVATSSTSAADTAHPIKVAIGDWISISVIPTNTPTNPSSNQPSLAINFVPDSPGDCVIAAATAQASASAVSYNSVADAGFFAAAVTTTNSLNVPSCMIRRLRVYLDTAPGGTAKYNFTLNVNAAASVLSADVVGAATTGSDLADSIVVKDADLLVFAITPTGTPTGSTSTDRQHLAYTMNLGNSGNMLPLLM